MGIFTRILIEAYPLLLVQEECCLKDPMLLENFIDRLCAYYRLWKLLESNTTPGNLVKFNTSYKLKLMEYSPVNYRQLGQVVARVGRENPQSLPQDYSQLFREVLCLESIPWKHAIVLYHVMGYFK